MRPRMGLHSHKLEPDYRHLPPVLQSKRWNHLLPLRENLPRGFE